MGFQVIGVVGLPGSGKTEVATTIAGFGIPRVRMGDLVWEEIKRRGQKITEKNVGRVSNELRDREGKSAIAKRCIPLIELKGKGKPAVVVDGIRGLAEVEAFRRKFGRNFHLIATWASEESRFRRIASRGRADDPVSREQFRRKDLRELSWGLGEAIALSDSMIINERTLKELRKKVKDLYQKMVGGKVEATGRGGS